MVTNKNKAEQMLATVGIQPSEVSRIINLARDIIQHSNNSVKKQLKKDSAFYETEKGKMIASAMDIATCKAMIERTYYLVNPNQYGDSIPKK